MGSRRSVILRIPLRPPDKSTEGLSDKNSTANMSSRWSPGLGVTKVVLYAPCLSVAKTPTLVPKAKRKLDADGAAVEEKMETPGPRVWPGPMLTNL